MLRSHRRHGAARALRLTSPLSARGLGTHRAAPGICRSLLPAQKELGGRAASREPPPRPFRSARGAHSPSGIQPQAQRKRETFQGGTTASYRSNSPSALVVCVSQKENKRKSHQEPSLPTTLPDGSPAHKRRARGKRPEPGGTYTAGLRASARGNVAGLDPTRGGGKDGLEGFSAAGLRVRTPRRSPSTPSPPKQRERLQRQFQLRSEQRRVAANRSKF